MDGSCIGLSVIPGRMSQERALAEFQGPPLTEYMASLWEKFVETNDGSLWDNIGSSPRPDDETFFPANFRQYGDLLTVENPYDAKGVVEEQEKVQIFC